MGLYSCGEAFGYSSLSRGDWDTYSDVDLLAIAPSQAAAETLADALLTARLGDDVLPLSAERWHQLRASDDPHWRAIGRDAQRLDRITRMNSETRYPQGDEAPADLFDANDSRAALATAKAVVEIAAAQLAS